MIHSMCLLNQRVSTLQRPLVVWFWGETFYSVVLLYIDHQHGLLTSSKAHRIIYKLLHIKKKKRKRTEKEAHVHGRTVGQQCVSYSKHFFIWSSQLWHFSWPITRTNSVGNRKSMCIFASLFWSTHTFQESLRTSLGGYIAQGPETTDQCGAPLIWFSGSSGLHMNQRSNRDSKRHHEWRSCPLVELQNDKVTSTSIPGPQYNLKSEEKSAFTWNKTETCILKCK